MHGAIMEPQKIAWSEAQDPTDFNVPCRWYALLVESGKERRVCIWLRRRQYEPYWPRFKGPVKLNRHRKAIRWRSVIPGYLFLPIGVFRDANWPLVKEAPGLRGILTNGSGNFVEIPTDGKQGIERIKEIESALNESPIAAAQGIPFKVNQKVRIPRLDLEGTIKSIEKGRKVIVEMLFLGALRPIPLPVQEIEAV